MEEDLPLPPVCECKRVEHEDWDQELSEHGGGDQEENHKNPFSESPDNNDIAQGSVLSDVAGQYS